MGKRPSASVARVAEVAAAVSAPLLYVVHLHGRAVGCYLTRISPSHRDPSTTVALGKRAAAGNVCFARHSGSCNGGV